MSAATLNRLRATLSKKRSGWRKNAAVKAVREAASEAAMERLLNALVGDNASEATRASFRERITSKMQ